MKDKKKVAMGKKSRAAGQRFELRVNDDLEKKGWVCAKWTKNVEFMCKHKQKCCGRLIKVRNKFLGPGKPMMLGAGFPDFIAFRRRQPSNYIDKSYEVIGVESKMNGKLTKEEKEKCLWLIDNRIFSKILIAQKGEKRGEILYKEFMRSENSTENQY